VRSKLAEWFEVWQREEVLERCERLPDAWLTIRNAGLMQSARRSFGVAASAIEATLNDDIELEEGLQRVADAFANSPSVFAEAVRQLRNLTLYADSFETREKRRHYLLGIEHLPEAQLAAARRRLQALADDPRDLEGSNSQNANFNSMWEEFHHYYTEHYVARHTEHFDSDEAHRVLDQILRGETWRELEALASFPLLGEDRFRRLKGSFRRASAARCLLAPQEVRELLRAQPACICGFRLSMNTLIIEQARELEAVAHVELNAYRRTLARLSRHLADALRESSETETNMLRRDRAVRLAEEFAMGSVPLNLTRADVELMRYAVASIASPPPLRVELHRWRTRRTRCVNKARRVNERQ
jgi:hypothetical protein